MTAVARSDKSLQYECCGTQWQVTTIRLLWHAVTSHYNTTAVARSDKSLQYDCCGTQWQVTTIRVLWHAVTSHYNTSAVARSNKPHIWQPYNCYVSVLSLTCKTQLIFMSLFSCYSTQLRPGTEGVRLVFLYLTVQFVVDMQCRTQCAWCLGARGEVVNFVAAMGQIMCCCLYLEQAMTEWWTVFEALS